MRMPAKQTVSPERVEERLSIRATGFDGFSPDGIEGRAS